jgi:hypothetical protein
MVKCPTAVWGEHIYIFILLWGWGPLRLLYIQQEQIATLAVGLGSGLRAEHLSTDAQQSVCVWEEDII